MTQDSSVLFMKKNGDRGFFIFIENKGDGSGLLSKKYATLLQKYICRHDVS